MGHARRRVGVRTKHRHPEVRDNAQVAAVIRHDETADRHRGDVPEPETGRDSVRSDIPDAYLSSYIPRHDRPLVHGHERRRDVRRMRRRTGLGNVAEDPTAVYVHRSAIGHHLYIHSSPPSSYGKMMAPCTPFPGRSLCKKNSAREKTTIERKKLVALYTL